MTRLAASIFVQGVEQALAEAASAGEFGADLVEFRIDRFVQDEAGQGQGQGLVELVRQSPLPCIVTCRAAWEGGEFAGSEDERLGVLERLVGSGVPVAYLDIELAAYVRAEVRARVDAMTGEDGPGLILSAHDFEARPADLERQVEAMVRAEQCRVVKVAWQARSVRDNLEALELAGRGYKPTVSLCMGRFGLASRVLAKKYGAFLTFASVGAGKGTAPGQPTLGELKELYRWNAMGPRTKVYAVVGWPVEHSMSPGVHNAGFDAVGFDGVYLPMAVPPEYEHFKASVGAWLDDERLDFEGASVTIPHKENLLRFVRERGGRVEALAERIGAANTLTLQADGLLYASNTDYAAALEVVCDGLGVGLEGLAGKRVAVLGAGGVARAVVAGFAAYGAKVSVYNRTLERAQALAEEFSSDAGQVDAQPMAEVGGSDAEVVINCTSMGMHPEVEVSPVGEEWPAGWTDRTLVFDTIYNPATTQLLEQARERGCATVGGVEMFVRQAAGQFTQWTGEQAPLGVFRRVMGE